MFFCVPVLVTVHFPVTVVSLKHKQAESFTQHLQLVDKMFWIFHSETLNHFEDLNMGGLKNNKIEVWQSLVI